jgi:hypothetical protein
MVCLVEEWRRMERLHSCFECLVSNKRGAEQLLESPYGIYHK